MNELERLEKFSEVLEYIKNKEIKTFAHQAILELPDYFFVIPASSTGKYHPSYTLGEGGLVRHTLAAMRVAIELYRLEMFNVYTSDEKDLILVALMLHDGWKSGEGESAYTFAEHPKVAVEHLEKSEDLKTLLSEDKLRFLFDCIETHMGQWNTDYKTKKEILRKPEKKHEKFVHMCDYIASRKCIEMNFEVPLSKD